LLYICEVRLLKMNHTLNPAAAPFTPRPRMSRIKIVSTNDPSQIALINVPSQTRCLSMADLQRYFPEAFDLYFPESVSQTVWGTKFFSVTKYMSVNEMWFKLPPFSLCQDVFYVLCHKSHEMGCGPFSKKEPQFSNHMEIIMDTLFTKTLESLNQIQWIRDQFKLSNAPVITNSETHLRIGESSSLGSIESTGSLDSLVEMSRENMLHSHKSDSGFSEEICDEAEGASHPNAYDEDCAGDENHKISSMLRTVSSEVLKKYINEGSIEKITVRPVLKNKKQKITK